MNKIYFLIFGTLSTFTFAQQNTNGPAVLSVDKNLQSSSYTPRALSTFGSTTRVPGVAVYTETFGDPFNNGWTTSGTGSSGGTYTPAQLWLWDDDGPDGFYSESSDIIQSTTVGDGYLILDGDFFNGLGGPPTTVEDFHAEVVSPPYDLTVAGVTDWTVRFEHSYRNCCSSAEPQLWMEVSTNGFTSVSNSYNLTYGDAPINVASGTRTWYINVTNDITANPATTSFRFRWGTPGALTNASHYFWMIDDFSILESYDNHGQLDTLNWTADLANFGMKGGFQKIPFEAAFYTTLSWTGYIRNLGSQDWSQAVLQVDENGSSFATSAPENVSNGMMSSLHTATATMPTSLGNYQYTLYGTASTNMDLMDTAIFDIQVTINAYSTGGDVETGIQSGTNWNWNTQPVRVGFGGEVVGTYPFPNMGIEGVRIMFQDTSINDFAPMEVVILINGAEVYTQSFTADGNILGTYQDVIFPNMIGSIHAGDIVDYLVVDSDGEGRFIESGSDAYHVGLLVTYDGANVMSGPFLEAPIAMEMLIGFFGAVDEEENSILTLDQNLPNPYNNNTIIKYSLSKNSNVQLDISDVSGKKIKTLVLGSQGSGQHQIEMNANEFNKGIYFYTLTAGDSRMTKKMVVTK